MNPVQDLFDAMSTGIPRVSGDEPTKVDGIYDSDPKANPDAKKFDKISYLDVLTKELNVMDAAAISLCKDNDMPLLVFNMTETGNIARVLKGEGSATLVY